MTTDRSAIEQQVRDELRAHLDSLTASRDLARGAVARAHVIRGRRRTIAAVTSAAAAFAVAAPFVWWSVTGPHTRPAPATTSTTVQSSTPTTPAPTSTTPTSTAPPSTASTAPSPAPTLDFGQPALATALPRLTGTLGTPDVPYIAAGVLHDGGREVTLDLGKDGLSQAWPLSHGGVAVPSYAKDPWSLRFLDASGAFLRTATNTTEIVASSSGDRVAYTDTDGGMRLLDATGRELARRAGWFEVDGVIGDTVYATDLDRGDTAVIAWDTATDTVADVGQGRMVAVHEGTSAGLFEPAPFGSRCVRLVGLQGSTMSTRWTSCGDAARPVFSRSGSHIFARISDNDVHRLEVFRASDGRAVLEVDGEPGGVMVGLPVLNDAEDAVTMLAEEADLDEALVRCTLSDGSCQPVTESRRLDTSTPNGVGVSPYVLLHWGGR